MSSVYQKPSSGPCPACGDKPISTKTGYFDEQEGAALTIKRYSGNRTFTEHYHYDCEGNQ